MSYLLRTLLELLDQEDPAWPLVQEWIAAAQRPVEVLPPATSSGASLVSIQITTRSPLGAVVYHSGGLLVDHGWLRILGSGHPRLPRALPDWNFACGMEESDRSPPALLVADDVIGGFFALNGGRFAPSGNAVWYFAPDTLEWIDLGAGYSDFLAWCLSGDLDAFYAPYRWTGWEREVCALPGDQAFGIHPFLSADGPHISERHRQPVPIGELFRLHVGTI
jgi:hypothetical protein